MLFDEFVTAIERISDKPPGIPISAAETCRLMQAIDLGSRTQRRFVVVLTSVYPALWLFALLKVLSSDALTRWAVFPALAVFLISALAGFSVVRAGASAAPIPAWSRFGIYISWGWLIPYCLISAAAIAAFEYLWPAFGILVLPALLFIALPMAREQFLKLTLCCVVIAGLYILVVVDAGVVWKLKLTLEMAISAGPFWSLAAYLVLYEHLVHDRTAAVGAKREARIASALSILGILIFFMLAIGVMILAMTGFQ